MHARYIYIYTLHIEFSLIYLQLREQIIKLNIYLNQLESALVLGYMMTEAK